MGNKSCDSWWWKVKTHKNCKGRNTVKYNKYSCDATCQWQYLQFVVAPLEWPAMSEVVLRIPRAGGTTPSSAWVRGTELARVETRRRSGWSSLRLRRRRLRLGSLKLRPLSRLIRLWETTSSKRSRCFLGMKILTNIVESEATLGLTRKALKEGRGGEASSSFYPAYSQWKHHLYFST